MTKPAQTTKIEGSPLRLSGLLDLATELVDRLDQLSQTQGDVIRDGDIEQVVQIVSDREPLVREIVRVGEEIGAIIDNPRKFAGLEQGERASATRKITHIERAMKRLRARDAQDQQLMESTRDALGAQLAEMGTNRSALAAYSSRPQTPNPILQDRQG